MGRRKWPISTFLFNQWIKKLNGNVLFSSQIFDVYWNFHANILSILNRINDCFFFILTMKMYRLLCHRKMLPMNHGLRMANSIVSCRRLFRVTDSFLAKERHSSFFRQCVCHFINCFWFVNVCINHALSVYVDSTI